MRKHFLILMLMALLPMAGWATDITNAVVKFLSAGSAPITKTYNATQQDLPDPTHIDLGEGDVAITNMVDLKWYKGTVATGNEIAKTGDAFKFTDAGIYKCTFRINASGYEGTATGTFEVGKATLTVTADNLDGDNSLTFGDPVPDQSAFSVKFSDFPTAIYGTATTTAERAAKEAEVLAAQVSGLNNIEYTTTYTQWADVASTYKITPIVTERLTSSNYNFAPVDGTLNVKKKNMETDFADFTVAAIPAKTYTALAQAPEVAENTTPTDETPQELIVKIGNHKLKYNVDYTVAFYTAENYNTNTYAYTGAGNTAGYANAGTYYVKITGKGTNFEAKDLKQTVSYTIGKAALLIQTMGDGKANNYKSAYTGALKTWTASDAATTPDDYTPFLDVQGYLDDDDNTETGKQFKASSHGLQLSIVPVASGTGSTDGNAGAYKLKIAPKAGQSWSTVFPNYTVTNLNEGDYTITKKVVNLTINSVTINYDEANPFAADIANAKDYMTAAALDANFTMTVYPTIQAVTVAGKGTYDITAKKDTWTIMFDNDADVLTPALDKTANFDVKVAKGTLTVSGGVISIIPKTRSFTYGDKAPALEYTLTGLQDGVSAADIKALNDVVKKYISYSDGLDAGTHTNGITVDGAKILAELPENLKANYESVNAFKATYTIAKRQLTKIEVKAQSVLKNEYVNPAVNQSGLVKSSKTVEFTAKDYTITEADYNKLMTEYEFVVDDVEESEGKITAYATGKTAGKIGIKFIGTATEFTNFDLPKKNATAPIDEFGSTTAKEGVYIIGKLTLSESAIDIDINANATNNANVTAINGDEDVNVGKKNNVTVKNRSFTTNKWAVMVLPFETTVREISQAFGYAVVDVLDASKGDGYNIYFKLHMGTIKANQPFMVKTDALLSKDLQFEGVTTAKVAAETTPVADRDIDAGGTKFIGLYQQKSLKGAKQLWLSADGDWGYLKSGNAVTIGATRAYLQLPEESTGEARIFIEEPDGSTTAISVIAADDANVAKEGWYTLNGVKLNAAPVEKGVYINNGKKVVIK